MKDQNKTKKELINELNELRKRVDGLEALEKEYKKPEETLRQNEERLRAQYNGFPIPTYTWKRVGENFVLIDYNDAAKTFTNGSVSDFVGKKDSEMYSDMPEIVDELSRCLIGKTTIKREMVYRFQTTGESKQLAVSYVFLPPDLVMVHTEDISKRKQIEQSLHRERNLLNRITETSPIGITVVDREGKIVFANPQTEVVLGLTKSKITQRTYNDPEWHITDYDGNPFPDQELPFQRVIATGLPVYNVRHAIEWPNGRRVLLSINSAPLFDDHGKVDGMVSTVENITEEIRMERELRESEEKYKKLVEESIQGVIIAQGIPPRIIFANATISKISGFSKDELLALSPEEILKYIHPEDREIFIQQFRDRMEGKQVLPWYEVRGIRKDGTAYWLEFRENRIEYQGKPALLTTFIEITERKQAEEQILVANERLRYLLSATPVVIYTLKTSDGYGINFVSDRVTQISGYKPQEFIENSNFWIDHIHPEDIQSVLTEARKILDQEYHSLEYRFRSKDGTYIWVRDEMKLVRDKEGKPLEFVGYWADITERKRMENTLRESEERYRHFFDNSIDAVLLTSPDGSILKANAEACRIFGYTEEELYQVGRLGVVDTSDPRLSSALEERNRTGRFKGELTLTRKGGIKFPGEISSSVYKDKDGSVKTSMIIRDISEHKLMVERLQQERNLLNSIAETSPVGITVLDREGEIIFANARAERILGLTKNEITKRIHNAPEWRITTYNGNPFPDEELPFRQVMATGLPVYDIRHAIEWPNKRRVLLSINGAPLFNDRGRVDGVVATVEDITERIKMEEELRESEEKYRRIVEESLQGLIIAQGVPPCIVFVNSRLSEILGYSKDELMSFSYEQVKELIHPEDRAGFFQRYQDRMQGRQVPSRFEIRGIRKDGTIRWAEFLASRIEYQGKPAGYATLIDITERKQAEEALRRSEEKYRTILESIEEGYYEVDLAGNFTFLNNSMCRIFGYPKEELIGMNDRQYTSEETAKRMFQAYNEVYRTGRTGIVHEYEVIRKDKSKSYVGASVSLQKDLSGKPIGFRGIIRDITESKKANEALKESESRFRNIIETSNDGIIFFDGETRKILFGNHAMAKLLGCSQEDLAGRSIPSLHPPEEWANVEREFQKHVSGEISVSAEIPVQRDDGSAFYADISSSRIRLEKKSYFSAFFRDITERRRAEEQLRESEQIARQLSQENAIMAEVGQIISSTLNIDDVYERFAEKVREIIPFDRIGINIINPRDNTFTISYSTGLEVPGLGKGITMPLAGNYAEEIMCTRTKVLLQAEDLKQTADRFPGFLMGYQAGMRSHIAIPLISKDEVIGVLHLDSVKPNGFGENDLRLAERVSNQIAGAIANAELFMERQRAEEQLRSSQSQLRALSAHLQSIRESERTLIAREIHDELGQDLTGLKMDLSWLLKRFPADQEPLIKKAESMLKLIDTTIQSVRRISAKLRPGVLDDLGLNAAIEWQAQEFQNRTGIQCAFNTSLLEVDLDRDRSTTIFRILQETLTNVVRHARATRVNIFLGEKDADVVLIVEDNGRGITESEILDPKSLGLLGMRERAFVFGGKVQISGELGKGTTVMLRIPLQK